MSDPDPELFHLLVDGVLDYAIFVLDPSGRIRTWNPGARRIKQYDADEIIGQHFSRFYMAEDRARGKPERALATALAEGRYEDECWRVRKDGSTFWARVVITPLRDASGTLQGFAKVTGDLTVRRRAEESEEGRRVAEETNRLKDEFLATVSHELRTPLNILTGNVWRLRSTQMGEADRESVLGALDRNVRLMTRLVEDLLDMSRMLTGNLHLDLAPVELASVIESTIENLAPAARAKNLTIHTSLSVSAGPVLGDSNRLQQVIWNLLSNAVKFTDVGGRIEVRLVRKDVDVVMQVRDTGRGIATRFLPNLFDRFTQADPSTTREFGGMGLGLSVVKHLAEAHGGRVTAFSEGEGRGTTFDVYLPVPATLTPPDTIAAALTRLTEPLPQLIGTRVLVVDDQSEARESLRAILTHYGANVVTADSTREALRVLDQFRPDILLADIAMPEDDGYALIRQVRTQMPDYVRGVQAAAVTAYASTEDRLRVLAAGYQLHIPKPVDPADLVEAVATLARAARAGGRTASS